MSVDIREYGDADKKLRQKLAAQGKFDDALKQKLFIERVNLDVMGRWIGERIEELLGFEDDVVSELVVNMLAETRDPKTGQDRRCDPQQLQVQLTGFLDRRAAPFISELWKLLIDAQDAPHGIPKAFVERKKEELVKREKGASDKVKRERSRSRDRDRRGRGDDREAAQRRVVRAAGGGRSRSRSRSRDRRRPKKGGFSDAAAPAPAPPPPPPGKPALAAPWVWKESRSEPGQWYRLNTKTGERKWDEAKPKVKKEKPTGPAPDGATKIVVRHCLLKHAGSRRPSSHRSEKITRPRAEAEAEAGRVRAAVAGAEDPACALAHAARDRSDCPSSSKQGQLKPFGRGDLDRAFEDACFSLAKGELAPVLETASGFHVIMRVA